MAGKRVEPPGEFRVVSWNIRRGGAGHVEEILQALESHDPELAVLVEYSESGDSRLREGLEELGLTHQHVAGEDRASARVLIASRPPSEEVEPSAPGLELPERWAEVVVPSHDLRVAGVYVPVTGSRPARKRRMWNAIREAAVRRISEPYLIVGDWNTGDHPMDKTHPCREFRFTGEYRKLLDSGYVELWRACHPRDEEFSWYGRGRGFRIDHAFASPPLAERLRNCHYSHGEREAGVSDHSMLIVDLAGPPTASQS